MERSSIESVLLKNIKALVASSAMESAMVPRGNGSFPQISALEEVIEKVKALVFPDFFGCRRANEEIRSYHIGVHIEKLYQLLESEIRRALRFSQNFGEEEASSQASSLSLRFIDMLPEIKRLLLTDVEAMFNNDPAANDYGEIILSYPVVKAMLHYRTAYAMNKLGIPIIPRVITEMAHSMTGIDINPGAEIGEYFAIDHGTGVVIGETCIIGNHVILYQGVTLGAKNFSLDSNGHPLNIPRHPIIEDNVTIYANSTVLGRITVGRGSIIGGNIWLTHSVPPESKILQRRAIETTYFDGLGI